MSWAGWPSPLMWNRETLRTAAAQAQGPPRQPAGAGSGVEEAASAAAGSSRASSRPIAGVVQQITSGLYSTDVDVTGAGYSLVAH